MAVLTIANQKGGVGKTTTAATMAGLLCESKQRVLLIDCDPHASLTSYFGHDPEQLTNSLYDIFEQRERLNYSLFTQCRVATSHQGIDLIPASISLATLDRKFASQPGMGLVLTKLVQTVDDDYDHIIIDCPPVLGVLLVNALATTDHLFIPVQCEYLALKGLERMMSTIKMMAKAQCRNMNYTIVPTMFDRRTRASVMTLRTMRDNFAQHLWDRVIPIDTKFRDASKANRAANFLFSDSRGVAAYRKLVRFWQGQNQNTKVA